MNAWGWTWVFGEDEDEGKAWIQIGILEDGFAGDEVATIMCRDYEKVQLEHPEWITAKEEDAKFIVAACNASERRSLRKVHLVVAVEHGFDTAGLTDSLGEAMREFEREEDGETVRLGLVPDPDDPGRYLWQFEEQL